MSESLGGVGRMFLKWKYQCILFCYLNESAMNPTWCSTESMAALCECGFVEPEDRAAFLIKIGVMHVVRETETRERRLSGGRGGLEEWAAACLLNLCLGFEFTAKEMHSHRTRKGEGGSCRESKGHLSWQKGKSYLEIMLLTTLHLEFYCILQYIRNSYLVLNTFGEGKLSFLSQSNN